MPVQLSRQIVDLKRDEALAVVKARAEAGEDPLKIIGECREGMTIVGDLYSAGDYFLAELMLAGQIFKEGFAVLEPYLALAAPAKTRGQVVMATPKGDIHDLGKDIIVTLLRAQGFEVHDLGVDVAPDLVIDKVKEVKPDFVGFSALLTTTLGTIRQAEEMLVEAGLRDDLRLMVGGGVTTPQVKEYVRADFQSVDAIAGVNYCLQVMGGR
ncbi:MAG: cobalamin-dependent protein [Deltaproteobacteria bacterium]|nr:cobalamin-dependent protein [Deltaproteobacteria bacterium]